MNSLYKLICQRKVVDFFKNWPYLGPLTIYENIVWIVFFLYVPFKTKNKLSRFCSLFGQTIENKNNADTLLVITFDKVKLMNKFSHSNTMYKVVAHPEILPEMIE